MGSSSRVMTGQAIPHRTLLNWLETCRLAPLRSQDLALVAPSPGPSTFGGPSITDQSCRIQTTVQPSWWQVRDAAKWSEVVVCPGWSLDSKR